MILSNDKKFIKIRLKPHLRQQAELIEKEENQLSLRATYYCEYNKKLLVFLTFSSGQKQPQRMVQDLQSL